MCGVRLSKRTAVVERTGLCTACCLSSRFPLQKYVHLQTCLRAALAGLLLASSYEDESITRLLRMKPPHGMLPVRPESAPMPSTRGFPPPSLVAARAAGADMGSDRGMSILPRARGLLPVALRSPVARGVGVVVVVVANNPALMRW